MAIQYYMRGYNVSAPGTVGYVDWVVNDTPDSTAAYIPAPFLSVNIQTITVNKVVGSRVDNFLQPDEGYAAANADGYFFHLNSFDWLHASVPAATVIPVPSTYVGLAVTRGGTTNASGQLLPGALTNYFATMLWVEAEARWKFVKNTNGDHTTLGAYLPINTGDLTVDGYIAVGITPTVINMPTTGSLRLQNNQWITARKLGNTDGYLVRMDTSDRVQLGNSVESPFVYVPGSLRVDGYIRDNTSPALSGFIRNSNNTSIITFRSTVSTDIAAISSNASNNIIVGDAVNASVLYNTVTGGIHQFQVNTVPNFEIGNTFARFTTTVSAPTIFQVDNVTGSSTGQALTVRSQNATGVTSNGGALLLKAGTGTLAGGDVNITSGTGTTAGLVNVIIGATPTLVINSVDTDASGLAEVIGIGPTIINPRIYQVTTGSATGQILTLSAQNAVTTGGNLALASGTGATVNGSVDILTGLTTKVRVFPTTGAGGNSNTIQLFENIVRFDTAQSIPRIRQDDNITASATAQLLTLQAQNATGITSVGGDLGLTAGSGTTRDGYVRIQTGGIDRVLVTQTQTIILGNLLVLGTNTNINSTVVDIADRVIHVNSSAASFPGTSTPAPISISGFSVDRGSTGTTLGTKRDYYGLFWYETDGYWRFAANTDGYVGQDSGFGSGAERVLSQTLPIIASTFLAQPLSAVTLNTIPTIGGFRALTNTVALATRDNFSAADLILVSTETAELNKLIWGAASNNTGHIFRVTDGYGYDFRDANISTYTLTPQSSGTTTLQAAATVTALTYKQATTGAATGATTTVQAQNAATTGGNLFLEAGTGGTTDGYVALQVGTSTTASALTNKFVFNKGQRRNVTSIATTYPVVVTDDYIAITTLSAPFTITLPAAPVTGDEYVIKDTTGNAAISNVTVGGNGNNIDGFPNFLMSQPYAAATFTFTGNSWSVI